MKIRARSFFRFLLVLLLLAYAAAHVLVRTDFGRRHALRCLSDASGLSLSAEKARLTACLSLRLRNVEARAGTADDAPVVFSAPELLLSKRCRGVCATAVGATLRAVRPADGAAIPAAVSDLADATPGIASFCLASRSFGKLFFRLSSATLAVGSGPSETVFSSLDWTRRPLCLDGHPGAVQNRLSYGSGPVWKSGEEGVLADGRRAEDEWFEIGDAVVRFAGEGYLTGPAVVGRVASAAPETGPESPAPEAAPAPEEAPAPEPTPAPEEAPAPEPTPAPEEAPAPEPTPAPEEAPAPEPTPAPEAPPAPEPAPEAAVPSVPSAPSAPSTAN